MKLVMSVCVGLCLCFVFSIAAFGQERHQSNDAAASCQAFVTRFYTWYLGLPVKQKQMRKSDVALKSRPYLFSSELVRQLREDSNAQEKAGSDLVSLDADPFLADGAAERYSVRKVTLNGRQCWAEVHGVWEGKESTTPDVTPELLLNTDRWVFVNFYFPSPSSSKGWNLLDELKAAREMQKKYGPERDKKR